MGIYRMYTGEDGESHMEELQPSDPIIETLNKVSGCALQLRLEGRRYWQAL